MAAAPRGLPASSSAVIALSRVPGSSAVGDAIPVNARVRLRRAPRGVLEAFKPSRRPRACQSSPTSTPSSLRARSPEGRWFLFWSDIQNSASIAADGLPLDAAPVAGGQAVTLRRPGVSGLLLVLRFAARSHERRRPLRERRQAPHLPRARLLGGSIDLSPVSARSWFWPA